MPWTVDRYPASMRNMTPWVRDKAIEIANLLLLSFGRLPRLGALSSAIRRSWMPPAASRAMVRLQVRPHVNFRCAAPC
ncbi:hypothetical protein BTI_1617 [Burkholderia thailandensis MSMB121]|uniref:Uncharacterized protein n=1 Tax=Burkholderia humptydooensis MSMB43 TaxID=441157 RepID=A0ABN0GA28_9BURK|nr:hypothetical protein [Burkholderia humptydooensis]AGK49028.1 hypothetical protein BTI_1617 [Burkholderia thailandensis MSMB121]AJY43307.1 hypothetical protein BW21_1706 [Burkholderia sp. 2002721687]ATF36694.1 hypothetical protein CO709_27810 [Burkholderia thailandensis]EIP89067.1 hypothetical protein A33K_15168 [Burkholderia humptydooensis MSMB43]ALX42347.1 hypothetical protein AQ610_07905 [Burkholderia humptydooensis]